MIVQYSLKYDPRRRRPLTDAEIAAIEARAPRDDEIAYDEDCPPSTPEQLRQFRRVHVPTDTQTGSGS